MLFEIFEHATNLDMQRSGVYYIRSTADQKIYIGCTRRAFQTRLLEHLEDLSAGKHSNKEMQADYNAGVLFAVGVLCILTTPDLIERVERALITHYAALGPLYNVLGVTIPFDYYSKKV